MTARRHEKDGPVEPGYGTMKGHPGDARPAAPLAGRRTVDAVSHAASSVCRRCVAPDQPLRSTKIPMPTWLWSAPANDLVSTVQP